VEGEREKMVGEGETRKFSRMLSFWYIECVVPYHRPHDDEDDYDGSDLDD
jgi:hypothetical protein